MLSFINIICFCNMLISLFGLYILYYYIVVIVIYFCHCQLLFLDYCYQLLLAIFLIIVTLATLILSQLSWS